MKAPVLLIALILLVLPGLAAGSESVQRPKPAIGKVFVIALENHDLVQPLHLFGRKSIRDNEVAPYMNSLITPGNPNAAQVSYAKAYYNVGLHTHPSEPNYIWSEAGSSFGIHTDADPSEARGNWFESAEHLTAQLNRAGVSWKNYQEDIEFTTNPIKSACGKGPANPYNGTHEYCYTAKHNPMAFFADTVNQNVYPLARLFKDLANDSTGRYNWITPDLYNDAHTSPRGGFTYHGEHYKGDQAAVAAADHFLSIVIPKIMASKAFKANGLIILWWDEAEGGDDDRHPMPEIIISPLARGNAYGSSVTMSHSSDLKTMEEIFGLPALDNPIPKDETNVMGTGYNDLESVNDLSDLFIPGVIPDTFGPVNDAGDP